MAIRKYKPTTPGRRGSSVADFVEITRSTPEKSLLRPLPKTGGRNNAGRITTRHIGGGHKRQYRVIDFKRSDKDGVNARVAEIEYDPNRTARIALLHFVDGTKRYIIAPNKLAQGDIVETGPAADIKPGNNLPLKNIPVGTVIHAIELRPGGGAKLARSAGASVRLVAKDGPYAQLRLPSGEIRNVDVRNRATIGEVGNAEQSNINWGKAGRMRWKGVRPTVRGVADLADRGTAAGVDVTDFSGRQAQLGVDAILRDQANRHSGGAGQLGATTRTDLDGVNDGTGGDVLQRQVVAGLDVSTGTRLDDVALVQLVRRNDVALGAVQEVQQRDASRTVRVVLDVSDLGVDAVFVVTTEVDHAVLALVATTDVTRRDATLVVTTTGLGQRTKQRLLGRRTGDLCEVRNR